MFCRFCGGQEKADAIFCSKCGSRISIDNEHAEAEPALSVDATQDQAQQKKKPKTVVLAVAIVAVLAAIGIAIGAQSRSTLEATNAPTDTSLIEEEPVIDKTWVPDGYEWQNDEFAVKWVTNEGDWPCDNCNFWKLKVVPHYDCNSGVYAELNMLDYAETVVDWTNDSLPSLSAGQTGLLIFENYPYDEGIDAGQLTELTCHM
jgi:hypothetical protein